MIQSPDVPNELFSRVHGYLVAMQNDELTPEQHEAFEALICSDPTACEVYISYMAATASLRAWPAQVVLESTEDIRIATIPSIFGDTVLSTTLHGTIGWFSSGWPVAYLIATVIFGIGLLIGSVVHVSQPVQVARQSSMPSRTDAETKKEIVGKISGMVDCKWAGTALDSPAVPLGRKYELASGLMEITYDTGAKVILQGPVTYEVESATGGYLSVGKLTARVEKKVAVASGQWLASQKSEIRNQKSLIPNP